MIVVIEGADGAGKTSIALELVKYGFALMEFPSPTTYVGRYIRDGLRRMWTVNSPDAPLLEALAIQSFFTMERLEARGTILAAKESGANLVLGRYWQSGWVYGQLDGLAREWLEITNSHCIQADLNILLDTDIITCIERRSKRKNVERYEEYVDQTTQTIELYRKLWTEKAVTAKERWVSIDARKAFTEVLDANRKLL
jgi:thymidylate kinase